MTAPAQRRVVQRMPPGLASALLVLVVGIVGVFALGAWWTDKRIRDTSRDKDRAMCQILEIIVVGPEPPPGPEGERARVVRDRMTAYQRALHCDRF